MPDLKMFAQALRDPEFYKSISDQAGSYGGRALASALRAANGLGSAALGAPVDIANMALHPFGLGSENPVMGSRWIAQQTGSNPDSTAWSVGSMLPIGPGEIAVAAKGVPVALAAMTKSGKIADALKSEKAAHPLGKFESASPDEQGDALLQWAKDNNIDLVRTGASNKSNSLYYVVRRPKDFDPEYGWMDYDTAHIRLGDHFNQTNTDDYLNAIEHFNVYPGGDRLQDSADAILHWLKQSK